MRWTKVINTVLGRMGYQIVQLEKLEHLRQQAARDNAHKVAERPRRGAKVARGELPADYDDEAKQIIRAVRPYTMTSHEKLYALIQATRHVCRSGIPGAIVECGVWRGGSMQAVARTLLEQGDLDRDLFLFDTFEGMPPPSEKDRRFDGRAAADLLAASDKTAKVWAAATLDDVKAGLEDVGYPTDRIHFIKGLVEETVPSEAPHEIAILRLDTDWYESTRHELQHLYPRLAPGGVLIIDDYGWWQGSRQAVDEFLDSAGERLLLHRIASGRIAVKPLQALRPG